MSANSAIYLPCKGVDLRDIFGADAKVHAGSEDSIEAFKVKIGGDDCIFNILPENEIAKHVAGFKFYISSLEETEERKGDARMAVEQAETILGLVVDSEFEDNPEIWQSLFKIADFYNGYIFVHDSLLLPNGGVIIGPLRHQ